MSGAALLAVDVGGTTIKSALVGADGRVLSRQWLATGQGAAAEQAVTDSARHLGRQARDEGLTVVGAGVVSPGVIDPEAGVVRYASNLDWTDVSLSALVRAGLDVPVAVGHDARAAGEAEGLLGAARGRRDYVHVSIGTGIAASLVVGGTLVAGSAGGAGELGHAPVVPDGEACPCGQRGCLEVYASGGGIARRYLELTGRPATAREVAERLVTDRVAQQVWDDAVRAWVTSLASLTLTLEPELVVLGGGLAQAGDALLDPVRAGLRAALTWRTPPAVEVSTLGSDAALTGAALLAARAAGVEVDPDAWGARA
ncbi:ROK family protein [Nocardioides campestrisoli]|uniref:ROK family protein n=1 Tax=Nocardioides campestrisoli TaxID=2736757 RepID=UPI0015E74DBB|nr:ROK family protein [Nocardioides campestrisoli]